MAKIKVYLDNCAYNRPQGFSRGTLCISPVPRKARKHYTNVDLREFNRRAVEYDKNNPVR